MQVEGLDTTVVNYINEIKTNYEQEIKEIKEHFEHEIHTLKNDAIEYHNKYLDIKERYDLLLYKRFMRSAEQMPVDGQQPLLFTAEAEPVEPTGQDGEEARTEVRSHSRGKRGRKPIDPRIRREITVIDLSETEKICACGAHLTKIGVEISERLQFVPQRIYVEQIQRPKYACRSCEGTEDEDKPTVRIAPVPPSMIPRGIASPSLLSALFTHKARRSFAVLPPGKAI